MGVGSGERYTLRSRQTERCWVFEHKHCLYLSCTKLVDWAVRWNFNKKIIGKYSRIQEIWKGEMVAHIEVIL